MADVNANAPTEQAHAMAPPTRTDDQILPLSRWVPIGKSNCYLDVDRSQSNPIYKIAVDILKYTNFFKAFIASLTIPSIYIQQFWDTVRCYPKVIKTLSDVVTNDMFQPWITLTTIINLCLTGKTSGFERPRAPVLQILWGGKKKATLIVIPSVRFTKLIIYYLQSKHKFHPRPGSPLHLPNEESVLGYLKFCAKGTKQEVFGMPIPNDLITDDIRGKQYYNAYLEKVAKHQRYLASEEVSDPDSPAPKLSKATKTKQSKPLAPKAAPITKPAAAKTSKLTSSQQPKPIRAPAKPQKKKRKLVTETSEAPSPAKLSKVGKVVKKRTQKSSLQLVDEFVDEGVPVNEPRIGDEKVDMQKAVEESLKEVHAARQGPLPLGKDKVSDEQVALDLLTLQTPKKESPADQYIFQRHTPAPTESLGHAESPSLYAELGLTNSDMESNEEVPPVVKSGAQDEGQAGPNPSVQDEDQARPNPGVLNEGQAEPNPGEHDEGQAGPNPSDAAASQSPSSHVVHAGPNLEHMDLEASDTSIQPNPEQMDEEFTTTAYPNELSFANQFLMEKSQEDKPKKTNTELEVQSMVTVPIHQDTSFVPLITTPVIDLTVSQPVPTTVSKAVDEIVTDAVDWAIQAPLRDRFSDLPEADMKEILHHRMWESNSYQAHKDHKILYEALEKSMARDHTDKLLTDLAKTQRKKKKRRDSPKTPPGSPPHQPPPPPPPTGSSRTPRAFGASGSSQLPPPPLPSSTNQRD
ncbi:hypothetical protein Tco_0917616 [Tanacetum coccineum]